MCTKKQVVLQGVNALTIIGSVGIAGLTLLGRALYLGIAATHLVIAKELTKK